MGLLVLLLISAEALGLRPLNTVFAGGFPDARGALSKFTSVRNES